MGTLKAPEANAPAVVKLCEAVCSGEEPRYVKRQFDQSAGTLDCFVDVDRRVSEQGGQTEYGWRIWIWPAVLIEAEFHAVWRSPEGELIDISTPPDYASCVLFLPDPTRVWDGRQVKNVRVPLADNAEIAELIGIYDRVFEIQNHGELAYQYGRVEIESTPEIEDLMERQLRVSASLARHSDCAMSRKVGRNELCPCLSGLKFKKCCGRS